MTITLSKELVIGVDTSLDSLGLVTISGGGKTRVMHVKPGIHLDLSKITLADGKASDTPGSGGDLWNEGGIVNLLDTTVDNGAADHNGADILSQGGTLTLGRVTLSNGKASGDGGALYIERGKVMLSNVTISTNSALGHGGGLVNFGGTVDLINVTLYKNTAPADGTDIYNADAAQSGAGTGPATESAQAPQNAVITVKNTIIANDKPKDPPTTPILNCKDVTTGGNAGKNIVDGGKNLQYPDNSCGDNIVMANPKLAILGNYGHYSKTHALLAGSPAINTAEETVCEQDPVGRLDERNVRRPFGSICDIGAYEYVIIPPTATPVPPTPTPRPYQPPPGKKGPAPTATLAIPR